MASVEEETKQKSPYGEDSPTCPIRWMLDRIGERWSLYVLLHLHDNGAARFSDLMKGVPNISSRMLALTLDKLAADGLIERRENGALATYALTDLGRSLMIPMRSLLEWVGDHARELDAGRRKFGLPPLDLPPGALDEAS